jgi:hypothetical protein
MAIPRMLGLYIKENVLKSEVSESHGNEYEADSLLGCCAV